MPEKPCFKCNGVFPLEMFYKHPRMPDGHVNKCKECNKRDVRERYDITRPEKSAYERKRNQTAERRKSKAEYHRQHNLKNPEKARARYEVAKAIKRGDLIRQPCVHCGEKKVQAHHRDYSKPVDVVWACFKCHREIEHGQEVVNKDYGRTEL